MNTIELRTINGIRNDVSAERFDRSGAIDLQTAVNCDLDHSGKVMRRAGTKLLASGSAHSLHAAGDCAYLAIDGTLKHLAQDLTLTPITAVSGRVAMATIHSVTYWSDGTHCGALAGAVNSPWGIFPPPVLVATTTFGTLRAGRYLFAMTYVRASGEESGATKYGELIVGENQGIRFCALPVSADPLVTDKRIYLTGSNDVLALLALTLANAATEASYTDQASRGMALQTQFMGPPPAGQGVGYFAGRAFVAQGRTLYYSQPFAPGLFDLRSGFVSFDSEIRTFSPVSDGVFVGTETTTYWLGGADPTQWVSTVVADFGTVLGTECELRADCVGLAGGAGKVAAWFGKKGLCIGFDGGQMKNVSGGRFIPPAAKEGASLMKFRGGTPQLVTTLFS